MNWAEAVYRVAHESWGYMIALAVIWWLKGWL